MIPSKLLTLSLVAISISNPLSCKWDAEFFARGLGLRAAKYGIKIERGVSLKTSDGTTLRADLYHPKTRDRKPSILVRIPFVNTVKNRYFSGIIGRLWASRGYHVMIQGTRGQYKSEGEYYPLIPERRDGIDTLQWISKQPWFDGRLGMWGGSYFGYTQWVLADQKNPGPSALMIQIASTDFYGMLYPGGAFSFYSALYWSVWTDSRKEDFPSEDTLRPGFSGGPLIEADDRAWGDIPYFNDWVNHPEKDEYWLALDSKERIKDLKSPVLLMAGWYDAFLPSQLEDYAAIRRFAEPEIASRSRLIIGPWAHAREVILPGGTRPRNYRLETLAPSIAWFDEHLMGGPEAMKSPVRIYVMGANVWRDENEWPLARAKTTPYYLASNGPANSAAGGGILTSAQTGKDGSDSFLYDPGNPVPSSGGTMLGPLAGIAKQNHVEARRDVLVYTSDVLQKDLEVTGPVKLILNVETSVTNTDFTAKLVDVHPDGSAYNVSDGILRRSYEPGQKTEIEIALWPTSHMFARGHRVRLEVSSSNYPRFALNFNAGNAPASKPLPARQTIYYGGQRSSRLLLPIVET